MIGIQVVLGFIYVPVVSLKQRVQDVVFVASIVASESSPPRTPSAS